MKCYSYIVARDYGFAPNPFGTYCTLATCKPGIRKAAQVGDWVIGTGSAKYHPKNRLVYAMRIDEKIDYNEYWNDPRFQYKKPILNGSLKQMYGDNIYHYDLILKKWIQEDSHHSNPDGTENEYNLKRDTGSIYVLISCYFWYFGKNPIVIPTEYIDTLCLKARGYKCIRDIQALSKFYKWLENNFSKKYNSDPQLFTTFKRYDGIS
ncbi:MAG TPA: hypothetical protein DDW50_08690 [Firmicutes bacterium]|jgi:hypothetical protein|nr:hypothetical protein [Bacillota bacterium]